MRVCSVEEDKAAREVAAMQFAGGESIEWIAAHWERDAAWVAQSIREALLVHIPQRDGGLKLRRTVSRAERSGELQAAKELQQALNW